MRTRWLLFLFALLAGLAAAGCSQSLWDEEDVYSGREHLADEAKGGDLLQAMDKAEIQRVVLIGTYNSTFHPEEPTDWNSAVENNQLVLDATDRLPERIVAVPLIQGDEPDLVDHARSLVAKGARGFALTHGLPNQRKMPLTDPRLTPFYQWCEYNHIPLWMDVDLAKYGDEFETVLRSYPNLPVIGGRMLGLIDDVPRLERLLSRYHSLYLDFSFGWDQAKNDALAAIVAQRAEFLKLLRTHYGRVIWGSQIVIAREAGRNVDWLTQYLLDNRYFLERSSVKLKLLLDEKPTLLKLPGLDLENRELAHLYYENLHFLLKQEPKHLDDPDIDRLLTDAPADAVFDLYGAYRLIVACVTSLKNPVESMFSARVKNVFTGTISNWQEINGIDAPIEIVTVAPLDQWLPKILKLDKTVPLKVLPNPEAVREYILRKPMTLAFVPFDGLLPGLRVIPIDGESPDTPYIRDCASRGGAMIGYYFNRYPLLVPLDVADEIAPELIFRPHELRRVVLTDHLAPPEPPPAENPHEELSPANEGFFKVAPLLQSFDLTAGAISGAIAEKCLPTQGCMAAPWLEAFDYTGYDAIALRRIDVANAQPLAQHHVAAATVGNLKPAVFRVREKSFGLLTFDAATWAPNQATTQVAALAAAGTVPLVFVYSAEPPVAHAATLRRIAAAGAATVVVAGNFGPGGLEMVTDRFIFFGLGNLARTNVPDLEIPQAMIARVTFYRDRLLSLDLAPIQLQGTKLLVLHGDDYTQATVKFLKPPERH